MTDQITESSGNVVHGAFNTCLPVDPAKVLAGALAANLESVTVLGRDADGNAYYASSHGYIPDLLLEIKLYEADLLSRAASHE